MLEPKTFSIDLHGKQRQTVLIPVRSVRDIAAALENADFDGDASQLGSKCRDTNTEERMIDQKSVLNSNSQPAKATEAEVGAVGKHGAADAIKALNQIVDVVGGSIHQTENTKGERLRTCRSQRSYGIRQSKTVWEYLDRMFDGRSGDAKALRRFLMHAVSDAAG